MDDYDKMCALDNLRRSYRWILSNPDAQYKNHFRDSYEAYAAASAHNLKRLRKHLQNHTYEPNHASKVYFPKQSGILRPYTLLTVNDQIVYQACINIIAEKLKPKVKTRYLKSVFGHIYAGKTSRFFYKKWQDGYRSYSGFVKSHINNGLVYVANFDLAAFYDSIDHHVLRHFLCGIGIDHDLVDFLLKCLKIWTSATWTNSANAIYHEHGIPQGPLSSGLLSEVVLKHIDDRGLRSKRGASIKYLRYVDDIKLFAKSETLLRQRLVSLDLAAKEIGLFPQSAKINIRKVSNPLEEIKTISQPPEPSITPHLNHDLLRKRLQELTRRGEVKQADQTRFKYLLANVDPHSSLNNRLLIVLQKQPAFFSQVANYFSRYKKIPQKVAEKLVSFIENEQVYHAVTASLLFATINNLPEPYNTKCADFCYKQICHPPKGSIIPQPTLKAALLAWVIKNKKALYTELQGLLQDEVDWWTKKDCIKYLDINHYGPASYEQILHEALSGHEEPARMAALMIVDNNLQAPSLRKEVNESSRLLLFAAGKIRYIGKRPSLVGLVLSYVLKHAFPSYNWEKLFGAKHKDAEQIAFNVKRYFESDINSCLVTLDSLCDLLWEVLFIKYLPAAMYGNYGSMLKNKTLIKVLPQASAGLVKLHELRLQSLTSHPRNNKTGNGTRRLKHHDYYQIKPDLRNAIQDIIGIVTV